MTTSPQTIHAINFICQRCGSMLKYKCKCPFCGGQTERIKPLPEIPVIAKVTKRCVEVSSER